MGSPSLAQALISLSPSPHPFLTHVGHVSIIYFLKELGLSSKHSARLVLSNLGDDAQKARLGFHRTRIESVPASPDLKEEMFGRHVI